MRAQPATATARLLQRLLGDPELGSSLRGEHKPDDTVDFLDGRVKPLCSGRVPLEPPRFECRVDRVLHSGHALHFPCPQNYGILKATSLLALLINPRLGIARGCQSDLDWEPPRVAAKRRERIRVNESRIMRVDVGCYRIRLRKLFLNRDVLEHPAADIFKDM